MNIIKKGSTDVTRYVMLVDSSDGSPETAYTITNLDLQYTRLRAAPAAKVDATALAATDSAHSDNQAIQIDATSSPGLYRIDWPDAAFATGVDKVILVVTGAGLHPAVEEIQLVDYDSEDGVRLGLTALPNAAADGAGGLPVSDAGGLDLDTQLANTNEVTAARMAALTDWINGGRLDLLLDAIKAVTDVLPDAGALTTIGTDTARLTAARAAALTDWINGGRLDLLLDAIKVVTDGQAATGTGLSAVPWNAAWDAEVQSEVNDALVALNLDHLMSVAVANNADMTVEVPDGTVLSNLMSKTSDTSTFVVADDSLEANRDHAATIKTDTAAVLVDTGADGVKLNATQPSGWAANLVASAGQIIKGTVDTVTNTHTPTTTEFQADDITEATADHYNGAIVIFTSGALAGQRTDITDYVAVGGIGQFTVTAMTEAPANNDTFVIV